MGDFGKFSLLKSLFGNTNHKIGVIWYLFPDELHNNDGGHTNYVDKQSFLDCDKNLCEILKKVLAGERSVAALEKAGLLPGNTVFFSEQLDFHLRYSSQSHIDKEERECRRKDWLKNANQSVSNCKVLFLDPDNGLQIASCPKINQMKSGKFAYYSEISVLAKDKHVCIIYHHLNRHKNHGTHSVQIKTRVSELREQINPSSQIFALRFRPYSPRAYFILTDSQEEPPIKNKIYNFLQSQCGKHWDSYVVG
ncbi:MAG TPA: hypothetical protein VJ624_03640 [Thermodesulfobacteriota bacterium]|nr:hypothetical protein [Thermodesulfobacteriota bacterium]